jgi:tetratricopeptide (TPR) repeat protein
MTHGEMNGQPVVCTASKVGNDCDTLLITLKHQDNAEKTLTQLSNTLLGYASEPLQQSSGDITYDQENKPYVEVNIEEFLNKPSSSQIEEQDNLTGIAKTIQDKAKQFTVRIDYPDGNGSGVIVAKNGETYYVLTAKHVVEQDQEYKVVTPDEKEYNVDASKIKTLEGADLAVLQFQSGQMYQVATLAEYKRKFEEQMENFQKMTSKQEAELSKMTSATSVEEIEKQVSEREEYLKRLRETPAKWSEQPQQYSRPWLFLFGWQRFNNTPQLRLTAGRNWTPPRENSLGFKNQVNFVSKSFDSLARSQSYQLSYSNFSQGGMSGGPVLDTLGRVIGIHAAAEGETLGLKEIYLGFSFGIPTKTVLSSINQAGIKPEWLKIEKVRPQIITKADEQSIAKNLLEIEPPGNDGTEVDWLNYGNDLWRIERYQEAIVAFDEAIKRKPDFYQAYYGKGLQMQQQGAKQFLQQAKIGRDISERATMQKIKQDQQKIFSLSHQMMNKSLPYFKKATEINPDFYPAWREIGSIKDVQSSQQNMLDKGFYIAGLSVFNSPLSLKANLLAQEALAAYNKATALNPSDAELYSSKASVLQSLSRHQEAIDAYTEAIKINPTAMFYDSRSKSYCAIGDEQKAEADIRNAEKLGSQNATKDLPVCGQGIRHF